MKQVYSPANAAEAHMLAHLLEQNGIQAHIHGEQLQGAVGDLPATGLLQLLAPDDDYDEARRLVLKWERSNVAPEEPQSRFRWPKVVILLGVGFFFGWLAGSFVTSQLNYVAGLDDSYDQNGDGRPDVFYRFHPGATHAHAMEADNNFDGEADLRAEYDATGMTKAQQSDEDFDGRFETSTTFTNGVIAASDVDANGDGARDLRRVYEHGVLAREEIYDESGASLVRVNHYLGFLMVRSEVDLDRDGVREVVQRFDRFGRLTSSDPATPR